MITLDTSAVLALLDRDDPDHKLCATALRHELPAFIVPAGILAEIGYLAELKVGIDALRSFLGDLARRTYTLDCGEDDFPRIADLVRRYADLPLGFADASVVACAERWGGRVMTLDRRDFSVVARERTVQLVLDQ